MVKCKHGLRKEECGVCTGHRFSVIKQYHGRPVPGTAAASVFQKSERGEQWLEYNRKPRKI